MQEKKRYALIGETLKHSYSKEIHSFLGDYEYRLLELSESQLREFVEKNNFQGFNVTIPYKKKIIEYLDELDDSAKEAGSVNTVAIRDGKKIGFNTDFKGMLYMINSKGISLFNKKVMILGTGGTASTATSVAKYLKAREIIFVSRNGEVNYSNYSMHSDTDVIINTTPLGMYPEVEACPINLSYFTNLSAVIDVIYNPLKTRLTLMAEKMGIISVNGLSMLASQGAYASEIWTGKKFSESFLKSVLKQVEMRFKNVVLIGMPGSGKSTVGRIIAKKLNLEFVDTDEIITLREKKTPAEIITQYGEEKFREIETEVIKEVSLKGGKVIATGGGAVLKEENQLYLKMNGVIFYLERDLKALTLKGRPLSLKDGVDKLFIKRSPIYESLCDYKVNNDADIESIVKGVINLL